MVTVITVTLVYCAICLAWSGNSCRSQAKVGSRPARRRSLTSNMAVHDDSRGDSQATHGVGRGNTT